MSFSFIDFIDNEVRNAKNHGKKFQEEPAAFLAKLSIACQRPFRNFSMGTRKILVSKMSIFPK